MVSGFKFLVSGYRDVLKTLRYKTTLPETRNMKPETWKLIAIFSFGGY